MKTAALKSFLGRIVNYHPDLARMLKSPTAAIMLSQGMYWQMQNEEKEGISYFWTTGEQWLIQTGLTLDQQKTARTLMSKRGFWLEQLRGVPARLYFSIDIEELYNQMNDFLESEKQEKPKNKNTDFPKTSIGKSQKLDSVNSQNCIVEIPETKEKITTKINTKITNNNKENKKFSEPSQENKQDESEKPNKNESNQADALKKVAISAKDAAKEVGYKTDSTLVEAFQMYIDYRKEMKLKPFASVKSAGIALKQLKRLSEDSRCASLEIVEQTIANLWTGLFPLKRDKSQQNGKTHYQPIPEEYGPQPF